MHDSKNPETCQTVPLFAVYVIWCRLTNQVYVGVTGQESVYMRIRQHQKGKKQFVDKQIQKIGWDGNWDYWIIEENVPANLITEREQCWIELFGCVFPNSYNKTRGGIKHFKHSQETRNQMSESHLGQKRAPFTEEHRANLSKALSGENHPNYGKPAQNRGVPCPEEVKDKIRKKLTGRKRPDQSERMKGENNPNFGKPMPEETKEILRQKALARDVSGENNPMHGKHHTEEAKEEMRQARLGKSPANKGVPMTEEQKEILRQKALARDTSGEKNGFFGKHHTEEAKERNRQAHLGKPLSEEHKAKLRGKKRSEKTKALMREKALARAAAKRAAKATAEENRAAANTATTNLADLLDAVILQKGLSSEIAVA